MTAYYNEIEPFPAQWLRNLISEGLIAPGHVDERDIRHIQPSDLIGFTQCHFFAGLGAWSYALRLAGWPDDAPVWTGSCPCQPFSVAGRGAGTADDRHLWPEWFRLVRQCRPAVVFGEQVASPDGLAWFDLVSRDLEDADYACGAADLCAAGVGAAGVGAPHIRQRLWFVADTASRRCDPRLEQRAIEYEGAELSAFRGRRAGALADAARQRLPAWARDTSPGQAVEPERRCDDGAMADAIGAGLEVQRQQHARRECQTVERSGEVGWLADADGGGQRVDGREERYARYVDQRGAPSWLADADSPGQLASRRAIRPASGDDVGWSGSSRRPWGAAQWLRHTDEKRRPVEPGSFPLAHGVAGRVGQVRAYGNAIVPQVAAEFIERYQELGRVRVGVFR